jgi:pyruvate,water dikinase
MGKLRDLLRKVGLARGSEALSAEEAEKLRSAFRSRYHNFKLLLGANNKALDVMSGLERALRESRPFGMSFVRSGSTSVSVNVFRMIQNLHQLAPGKYGELNDRFKEARDRVDRVLSERKPPVGDRLVLPFDAIDRHSADQTGNKMANMGELRNRAGIATPDGFVITAAAYRKFMEHNDLQAEIDRRLQSRAVDELEALYELSAEIQQLIIRSSVPGELEAEIMEAYHRLERGAGEGVRVSMRSSALGEDAAGTSFAGQYRSELNVSADSLLEAYKEVVASKYSLQGISYRLNRGLLDEEVAMCVGCMVMVRAIAGGVMYSRNPLDIRDDSIFINSVWGLPKSVVDGSMPSDLLIVSRESPPSVVEKDIKAKERMFACFAEEGVCRRDVPEDKINESSLGDPRALELAEIALRLERHYGKPLDIEWAIDDSGALFILQCRPLEQKATGGADRRGEGRSKARGITSARALAGGGVTASPGVACGPVFLVKRNSDALLFPRGAVLVTIQALPNWAPLLSRAKAVVTEQGSAAGHLANVAREFEVPALFGVPGAAGALEKSGAVTVDADGLTVYEGCVEELLKKKEPVKNFMEGSPVYEILREVVESIVPLNLLDPDSSDFKAGNCATFHDITRFCHEKAVKEMFSFGKEHSFSERASKQLVCDVPMLWWVINLDDGFKEDVPGKFVRLENIDSIPFVALWGGINAVPWEGPPPVNAKGFMSVLMEATTNTALDPSMPSHYTNKNYFMLSKNFCSLTSRFGFHFCTVETLVGERPNENYISFHFKGGAADYRRRLGRAMLVGDMLEEFGFRVEIKEDGMFARMEGHEEAFMRERLKILGYLLIHTRQIDMVMSVDGRAEGYKAKFMKDIASFTNVALSLEPGGESENHQGSEA